MNSSAEEALSPDRLGCLVLPVGGQQLLLPITAIAEVINPFFRPDADLEQRGVLGWITWRDQLIPLLSYEGLNGEENPDWESIERIAVINAVGVAARTGFWSLALTGIPKSFLVSEDTPLKHLEITARGKPVMSAVLDDGSEAFVPDLEFLEGVVAALTPP